MGAEISRCIRRCYIRSMYIRNFQVFRSSCLKECAPAALNIVEPFAHGADSTMLTPCLDFGAPVERQFRLDSRLLRSAIVKIEALKEYAQEVADHVYLKLENEPGPNVNGSFQKLFVSHSITCICQPLSHVTLFFQASTSTTTSTSTSCGRCSRLPPTRVVERKTKNPQLRRSASCPSPSF